MVLCTLFWLIEVCLKDCPQNTGPLSERGSGANAGPIGSRQFGGRRDQGSWRDNDGNERIAARKDYRRGDGGGDRAEDDVDNYHRSRSPNGREKRRRVR